MADDLGERTEDPTSKKLQDAKAKGNVAKSTDLNSVVTLLGALVSIMLIGGSAARYAADLIRRSLGDGFVGSPVSIEAVAPMARQAAEGAAELLLPVMAIGVVVSVVANAVQSMPILSLQAVQPKLSKLNPIEGFKRVFGTKGLVRTGMGILKMSAALTMAGILTRGKIPVLAELPGLPVGQILLVAGKIVVETMLWILAVLLLIALLDFLYQRWQHKQDLKMSKQEVKDERKSMDGSPEVKRRRMKMMQEAAQQRVASAVPQADVVVTNPTHFSVAIKYEQGWRAPLVTAKGGDHLAFRIRALAVSAGVPLVERPPLARALYWSTDVGQEIAPEHYEAVAEVLAYVYRIDEQAERELAGAAE